MPRRIFSLLPVLSFAIVVLTAPMAVSLTVYATFWTVFVYIGYNYLRSINSYGVLAATLGSMLTACFWPLYIHEYL
jgi:hypothetical protein